MAGLREDATTCFHVKLDIMEMGRYVKIRLVSNYQWLDDISKAWFWNITSIILTL